MNWFGRRRHRIEASREALAKQERLSPYIDMQKQDASDLGEWARDRLRQNGLTRLFYDTHERGAS